MAGHRRPPGELQRRLLEMCLLKVGRCSYPPPKKSVERILEAMRETQNIVLTLAGCLVQKRLLKNRKGKIIIKQELKKRKQGV